MKSFRIISRFAAVTAIVFVGNICAAINLNDVKSGLKNNGWTIGSAIVVDRLFDKNDHFNKAFLQTLGSSCDKNMTKEEFAQNLAINYSISKSKNLLRDMGVDPKKVLKTIDFLPHGAVRDTVNPMVEGAVEVATHPAFLTWLANYLIASYGGGGK